MVFGKSWNVDRDVKANCLYTAGMYVGDTKQVQVQVLNKRYRMGLFSPIYCHINEKKKI